MNFKFSVNVSRARFLRTTTILRFVKISFKIRQNYVKQEVNDR